MLVYGKEIKELAEHMMKVQNIKDAIFKELNMSKGDELNGCYGIIPFDGSIILEVTYGIPKSLYTPLGRMRIHNGGIMKEVNKIDNVFRKLGITATPLSSIGGFETNNVQFFEINQDRNGNVYTSIKDDESMLSNNGGVTICAGFMEGPNAGKVSIKSKYVKEYSTHDIYKNDELLEYCMELQPDLLK